MGRNIALSMRPTLSQIYNDNNNFTKISEAETELVNSPVLTSGSPLISVIIPLYKRKEYLRDAINSIVNQKDFDFEYEILVMCDDPDSSIEDAVITCKENRNIYFYRNKNNLGLYNNSNLGAKLAKGHYIAFLHDDDILYPDYFSNITSFLRKMNPEPVCILVNRDVIGIKTEKRMSSTVAKYLKRFLCSPLFLIRLLFRKPYKTITLHEGLSYLLSNIYKAPSCGTLFKKETLFESGGFNQDYWPASDYFFFLKFNQTYPIYMLRKKLACYRWFDNLSQNKSIQFSSFKQLAVFFKSPQPLYSINKYYRSFKTEVLYSKFLMINKNYRNEIVREYPELATINKFKWIVFILYNKAFRFFHDII